MAKRGEKAIILPRVSAYHDEKDENIMVEVELPGVKKENVSVEMSEEGLCVSGERDDFLYQSCYRFLHDVAIEQIKARFDNGLLRLSVPLTSKARTREVSIE